MAVETRPAKLTNSSSSKDDKPQQACSKRVESENDAIFETRKSPKAQITFPAFPFSLFFMGGEIIIIPFIFYIFQFFWFNFKKLK